MYIVCDLIYNIITLYMGVIDEMYPMTHKYKACSTLLKLCQCIINTLKFHNSSKF